MDCFKNRFTVGIVAFVLGIIGAFCLMGLAAVHSEAKTVSGGSNVQFTLMGLPSSRGISGLKLHTVQNFVITPDNKYVFTTSGADKGSKKNSTTVLACLSMPAVTGKSALATCKKISCLTGYGHGETLAISQPNKNKSVYNLWVGSKAVGSDGYSTEICRLTYNASNNKITKRVFINNFRMGNVSKGKAKKFKQGKPVRMGAAIDVKGNTICFRCCFKSGRGCDWIVYDFKKLDKALSKVGNNKSYSIAKAAKYQRAHLYSTSKIYPYGLFQSFDLSGKKLYIMGGHMNKGAGIYQVNFKLQKAGKTVIQRINKASKTITIKPSLTAGGVKYSVKTLEPEGMQIIGSKVYFNWFFKDTPIANNIPVYMFKL